MITRDELRRIPELHRQIRRDEEQLLFLREKATSIPSIMPDPNKVQTSPVNNANIYSDAAIDLAREIEEERAEREELQEKARILIVSLPCTNQTERLTLKVMRLRYLKCCSWDEVAELTGYFRRYVQRLEQAVVDALE